MIKRIVVAAAAVGILSLAAVRPVEAEMVLCWYCTGGSGNPGSCYTAQGSWDNLGGTGCFTSGGRCYLTGTCPLTVYGTASFDVAGRLVRSCAPAVPLRARSEHDSLQEITV